MIELNIRPFKEIISYANPSIKMSCCPYNEETGQWQVCSENFDLCAGRGESHPK